MMYIENPHLADDPLENLDRFIIPDRVPVQLPITSVVFESRPEMMPRISRIIQWHRRWFHFERDIVLGPYDPEIPHTMWINSGPLPPSNFRLWYSDMCVHGLDSICSSQYLLVWQWDGFIINPHLWTNDFLNWDYIGAPHGDAWTRVGTWLEQVRHGWESPFRTERSIAGNGGFSLRSKKFLQASNSLDRSGLTVTDEDMYLCVERRKEMVDKGVRFCPANIAASFSVDHEDHSSSFGFHSECHLGTAKRHLENTYLRFDDWRLKEEKHVKTDRG